MGDRYVSLLPATRASKTGRTEEEPMHEDFRQIHNVNNPPEKEVSKHGKP
jgi:hypothetical protein